MMNANAKKGLSISLMIISTLFLTLTPASAGPGVTFEAPSSGQAAPTATITLEETHIVVEVEEGELEDVESNGTVTVDAVGPGSSVQSVRVELWASSRNGWPTSIDPAEMTFPPGGGSEDFTWTVRISASNDSVTDMVTISGRAIPIPPGTRQSLIPDTTASVEVLPKGGGEGEGAQGEGEENGDGQVTTGGGSGGLIAALAVVILIFIVIAAFIMMRKRKGKAAPAREPSRKKRVRER